MSDTREQLDLDVSDAVKIRRAATILARAPVMVTEEPAWDLIVKIHPRFRDRLCVMLEGYANLLERDDGKAPER